MSTDEFESNYKHWHQKISFVKSGVRIAACLSAIITALVLAQELGQVASILILAVGFGLAEILGIFEEWI